MWPKKLIICLITLQNYSVPKKSTKHQRQRSYNNMSYHTSELQCAIQGENTVSSHCKRGFHSVHRLLFCQDIYILKYDIYLVYIHVTHYMTYIWYIPLTCVAGVQCNPYHLLWEGHLWKGTYLITKNITFFIEPFQIKKDYKDSNLIHIQLLGYYHPKVIMAKTGYNRPQCVRNQTVFKCGSLPPGTPRHPRPSGVHRRRKSLWQMLLDGQPWSWTLTI